MKVKLIRSGKDLVRGYGRVFIKTEDDALKKVFLQFFPVPSFYAKITTTEGMDNSCWVTANSPYIELTSQLYKRIIDERVVIVDVLFGPVESVTTIGAGIYMKFGE